MFWPGANATPPPGGSPGTTLPGMHMNTCPATSEATHFPAQHSPLQYAFPNGENGQQAPVSARTAQR